MSVSDQRSTAMLPTTSRDKGLLLTLVLVLALEAALKTHEWWFRVFITVFAICAMDDYIDLADWLRIHQHG
jgi:hypothetical protein